MKQVSCTTSKITEGRWVVRSDAGEALGFLEHHKFFTYRKGERVPDDFWLGRVATDSGPRAVRPLRTTTKREALDFIIESSSVSYNDRSAAWTEKQ